MPSIITDFRCYQTPVFADSTNHPHSKGVEEFRGVVLWSLAENVSKPDHSVGLAPRFGMPDTPDHAGLMHEEIIDSADSPMTS